MQSGGAAANGDRVTRANALGQRRFEPLDYRPLGEKIALESCNNSIDIRVIDALAPIAEKPHGTALLDRGSQLLAIEPSAVAIAGIFKVQRDWPSLFPTVIAVFSLIPEMNGWLNHVKTIKF
jgi:hypothetical protein